MITKNMHVEHMQAQVKRFFRNRSYVEDIEFLLHLKDKQQQIICRLNTGTYMYTRKIYWWFVYNII